MPSKYEETQKKVLYFMTGLTVLGFVLFLICVCTSYWNSYVLPENHHAPTMGGLWVSGHSGLWLICNVVLMNVTGDSLFHEVELCNTRELFPTKQDLSHRYMDKVILDYYRSQSAFAVIGLALMVVSHFFVVYSFRQTRYMFKRTAGCFHIMSAACILVVCEININALNYERKHLTILPRGTSVSFGFSFITSWLTFAFYILSALAFFVCSRKRKHHKVPLEIIEQNEPIRLGRL